MAKYKVRWTDDELKMMEECVANGYTLKETLEEFSDSWRTKGAISAKRRQVLKAFVDVDETTTEEVVEEVITDTYVAEDWPVEKEEVTFKWLLLGVATVAFLWFLTEGNYIDWS